MEKQNMLANTECVPSEVDVSHCDAESILETQAPPGWRPEANSEVKIDETSSSSARPATTRFAWESAQKASALPIAAASAAADAAAPMAPEATADLGAPAAMA